MGDLSDFQTRQIVGACLAGTSVTKTAILLRVSRAAVSKVMTRYLVLQLNKFHIRIVKQVMSKSYTFSV
jgi:predicted transcriptional regulator